MKTFYQWPMNIKDIRQERDHIRFCCNLFLLGIEKYYQGVKVVSEVTDLLLFSFFTTTRKSN
jgi:hypothetical protein